MEEHVKAAKEKFDEFKDGKPFHLDVGDHHAVVALAHKEDEDDKLRLFVGKKNVTLPTSAVSSVGKAFRGVAKSVSDLAHSFSVEERIGNAAVVGVSTPKSALFSTFSKVEKEDEDDDSEE